MKDYWTVDGKLFLDSLSETGKDQCSKLGKWARDYLKSRGVAENSVDASRLKWRSSKIERVTTSGKLFWKGFSDTEIEQLPYEQSIEDSVPTSDHYFRTWDSNVAYKKWANDLIKSELFVKKSMEVSKDLDEIVDVLSLIPFKKYPKPIVLYGMTFAREMVDCERYFEKPEKPLHTILNKNQLENIDALAKWCWNQRFFSHPEYSKTLGEKILGEIIEDMISKDYDFSLYSGHDYTLLIILASLGIPEYEELLSFGSYLLFDIFDRKNDDGSSERVFSITLNPTPFETNSRAVTEVQTDNLRILKNDAGEQYWPLSFFLV